jgi:hypothetical protein
MQNKANLFGDTGKSAEVRNKANFCLDGLYIAENKYSASTWGLVNMSTSLVWNML